MCPGRDQGGAYSSRHAVLSGHSLASIMGAWVFVSTLLTLPEQARARHWLPNSSTGPPLPRGAIQVIDGNRRMRFGQDTWSIQPPPGWSAWHDEDCAAMEAEPAVGALQISAAFKDSEVSHEDLLDLASELIEEGALPIEVVAGEFEGITFCYGEGDAHWQHWYLRNGDQLLFVTYNCLAEFKGVEDELVGAALKTLSSTDSE